MGINVCCCGSLHLDFCMNCGVIYDIVFQLSFVNQFSNLVDEVVGCNQY